VSDESRLPAALWAILALALVLRLLGAWHGNLTFDESAHLALAETIDFHPERFHLVGRSLDHPPLSIYVTKVSGLVFGESTFGLRVLHAVAGALTIIPVFLLGRLAHSQQAGLWAAGLLAVDQFHASWSRLFMPEVLMLGCWSVALVQLTRLLLEPKTRNFVLLGAWIGLACLAKETALLLGPVAWLVVAVRRPALLRDGRWYLAHGVWLLVILPDVVWNALHFSESYLHRDADLLSQPFALQLKSFSLYLGELFRMVIDPEVLDVDYETGNAWACFWPAGLLYLGSVVAAARRPVSSSRALLLIAFAVPFVAFTLVPGGERFDPFWWASPSLIAAVVCAGGLLEQWARRAAAARWSIALAVALLGVHYVPLALRPGGPAGVGYPRRTVQEFARNAILDARHALLQRDPRTARRQLIYALNIGGPDAAAYYLLGSAHAMEQQYAAAEAHLRKSLELAPDNPRAEDLLRRVRSLRKQADPAE
jgi:4-amino-4-deoxy-L-arabinose transferase-like glycosyltransferase